MSVALDPTPAVRVEPPATARRPRVLPWVGLYVLAQAAFLLVLRQAAPRFFWVDDQQVQYMPAFHWFGRHLVGGRPPLLSPEQGSAGNFVADAQYGVYDPLHWLLSALVGRAPDLNDAAWVMGSACVVVMGLGVLALLLLHRCRPALAVTAALGLASTGFFLWWGSSWFPLMLGTALLPWLWFGLASPSRWGVLITGVSVYQIIGSGYTYSVIFAGLTVLAQAAERWLRGGPRALLAREALARAAAGLAGLVAGLPTLVGLAQMAPSTNRSSFPSGPIGNPGNYVPNMLDAVVGGSTLTPLLTGFYGGIVILAPIVATAAFALPALALVRWRAVWRRPGVLTAALLWAVAAVGTQTPSFVGPLRLPFRYLAEMGVFLPILVALGLTYGLTVTRRRLQVAGLVVAAQAGLAVMRSPALVEWHVAALLVALLAVGSLAVGARPGRRPVAVAAAAGLIATAVLAPLVGLGASVGAQARLDLAVGAPVTGMPARAFTTRREWGTTVAAFRQQSALTGQDVTVLNWADDIVDPDAGWGRGLLAGNANLVSDVQPGFAYGGTAHEGWTSRGCQDYLGQSRPQPGCLQRMLEPVPGLDGVLWVDAMATDEVLLSEPAPAELTAHFQESWRAAGSVHVYQRYVRDRPTAGRVTATTGQVSEVVQQQGAGGPAYGGRALDAYRVSTGPQGGELVLRIPAWPGLQASVDGRAVEVTSIEDTLTVVRLPGGLRDAGVRVEFRPLSEDLLWPTLVLGGLGIALATALARPLRTRRDPAAQAAP